MKTPMIQYSDEEARRRTEDFIATYAQKPEKKEKLEKTEKPAKAK
jgi:hypothetical protein